MRLTLPLFLLIVITGCSAERPLTKQDGSSIIGTARFESANLDKARQLYLIGDLENARAKVSALIQDEPGNVGAHALSAAISLRELDYDKAFVAIGAIQMLDKHSENHLITFLDTYLEGKEAELYGTKFLPEFRPPGENEIMLSKIQSALPAMATKSESFNYALCLAGWQTPDEFEAKFPGSEHMPAVLLDYAAENEQLLRPELSRPAYQRLVKDFPNSKEAQTAKTKLGNWWESTRLTFRWQGGASGGNFKKGERIRLTVEDPPRTWNFGAFGDRVIDGDNVIFFIGNQRDWDLMISGDYYKFGKGMDEWQSLKQERDVLLRRLYHIGTGTWEGTVEADGRLFLKTENVPDAESETFTVRVERKSKQ